MNQFTAIVQGERGEDLKRLIGTNAVPLQGLEQYRVIDRGGGEAVMCFRLDHAQLPADRRETLIDALKWRWRMERRQVEALLDTVGYSIPVDECLVTLHQTPERS